MRIIGESKTVDLSKKLTVEISVGEIALLMAILGEITYDGAKKAVDESNEIAKKNRTDVHKVDSRTLYSEMVAVLKSEGVAG